LKFLGEVAYGGRLKMNKNICINMEETIKEEEKLLAAKKGSDHQMVQNPNGQYVDAHIDGHSASQLSEIGRGQVEVLLQLQVDSDTLRVIENVDSENEVLDRIQWGKKKKKKKKISDRTLY
jgi:hypothetical protein